MTKALVTGYLGLGSNLQDPLQQITCAVDLLGMIPGLRVVRQSPWYWSKAVGPGDQPDYVNGVIEIETTLEPHVLLRELQLIENRQGRTREQRWGARTLDIDILLFGDQQIHTDDLEIPHPRILQRSFVLVPLADLDPTIALSSLRTDIPPAEKNATIATLLPSLCREGLRLVNLP